MGVILSTAHSVVSVEEARLNALYELAILDTPPERTFNTLVACAARALGAPVSLISLVDRDRQLFKACYGLDVWETPREHAFCLHVLAEPDMLVIPDTWLDPRFARNPLVTEPPHIRFYAGVPVRVRGGHAIGALCILDDRPRTLSEADGATLRDLAHVAEALLESRLAAALADEVAAERQVILQRLERADRQFRQAERMAKIGSWRLSLADNRTEWSDQVFAMHGLPIEARPALGDALAFYPPRSRQRLVTALQHTMYSGQPFMLESDFTTAQGDLRRVRVMGELERSDGKAVAVMGVFQDITNRHRMEQALRRSATNDDLTGLPNRAGFNAYVLEAIADARAHGLPLALMLIDLDHFKAVNDQFGHRAGDALLVAVAKRLQDLALGGSFAARLGGDEFVVVITSPALLADLDGFLARLLADLCQTIALGEDCVDASGTIGVSWLDASVRDPSDLLHRADIALYDAKRSARGSAAVFGQTRRVVAPRAALA